MDSSDVIIPAEGRVIGLDMGSKRIGIAVCDDTRFLATPYGVIKRIGDQVKEHAEILNLVSETMATLIVIGLPLTMQGEESIAVKNVKSEIKNLQKKTKIPVIFHDERLTTVSANSLLDSAGVARSNRKDKIDSVAASVILQSWLDSKNIDKIHSREL